jgi:hypothetical protein
VISKQLTLASYYYWTVDAVSNNNKKLHSTLQGDVAKVIYSRLAQGNRNHRQVCPQEGHLSISSLSVFLGVSSVVLTV